MAGPCSGTPFAYEAEGGFVVPPEFVETLLRLLRENEVQYGQPIPMYPDGINT